MKKRILCLLLIMMCLSVLPLPALSLCASADSSPSSPEIAFPVEFHVTGVILSQPETYHVCLTAAEHAPMPSFDGSGSVPEHLEFAIEGPGEILLPPISFTAAGVYHYSISQIEGNHPCAHYDTCIYSAVVTVFNSDVGDGLKATVVIMKDGKKQDGAVFLNDYGLLGGNDPPEPDVPEQPPSEDPVDGPADEPPARDPDPAPVTPDVPPSVRPDYPPRVPYSSPPLVKLIQTGQLNWPVWLLGFAGAVLAAFGGALIFRGRKRPDKRKGRESDG